jgi:3'-phosphoadenosine 5'-phosphosulfate sulfotransferase (PAPS reductase)/FAD synthetase
MSTIDDEQRIEAMLTRGASIMQAALEEFKPIAVFAAYSGGNDSVVSSHFACTNYAADVVHCGTRISLQKTRMHVIDTCEKFGWVLHQRLAQPEGKPKPLDPKTLPMGFWQDARTAYEEIVLNYGFPGPAMHGRMYQRLKERPLARLVAQTKTGHSRRSHVMLVSGIRHDESWIRAGYKRAVQKDGGKVWVNPFYFQTAYDFEVYRQEFGLPRNPVSDRIGFSGECLCGAYAKPGEKELIRSVEPETIAYIEELERKVEYSGFPWGWGQKPPKWWTDQKADRLAGQQPLFFDDIPTGFEPMCAGCPRRRS